MPSFAWQLQGQGLPQWSWLWPICAIKGVYPLYLCS
jgi:hypothetical protein